jgi:hypothetical protein
MPGDCPLVIIRWEDSAQPIPRWQHLSDLSPPDVVECATVGWLLRDDDGVKVVAQSMGGINADDNMQASGVMAIPTRCVISIERLEEAAPVSGPSSCPETGTGPMPPQTSRPSAISGC